MTIEIINHTDNPVCIENFDKQRYLSTQYMHGEWQKVWRNTWQMAGLVSDVANPGDYFVYEIGREQILVAAQKDGSIQGFYNVCMHRGNRLATNQRGHAANFRCAYHAWTYSIDGQLSAVPYEERFADGVLCEERALQRVHTQTWAGMVFVNLSENPEPLASFLGPVMNRLAPYRFEHMTLVEDQTVYLNCNWKAVVDNFSELYHVDFLHPQHKRMVDCCNDTVHLFANGHTGLSVPGATVNPRFPIPADPTDIQSAQLKSLGLDPEDFHGRVMDVRVAVQQRKREIGSARGFHYDQFEDDQLSDVWQYNVFPNLILSFTPEHLWILRPRPHTSDPQRCEFDKISLVMFADPTLAQESAEILGPGREAVSASGFLPDDYQRPERDTFKFDDVIAGKKSLTDTINQDVELLGNVQAGMNSHGFKNTWLNDDEMRIQHFHNELTKRLSI